MSQLLRVLHGSGKNLYRAIDLCYDRLLGVQTSDYFSARELGHQSRECYDYAAVPYLVLRAMLKAVPRALRGSALIDYGCGLGRVLVVARRLGFRRVVGVELADSLVTAGRQNLHAYTEWQIVHTDSVEFRVPDEASVFYFGNPFGGDHLRETLRGIADSLARRPRQHMILGYYCVHHLEEAARATGMALRRVEHRAHVNGKTWAAWVLAPAPRATSH